jgi:hypothetical protein
MGDREDRKELQQLEAEMIRLTPITTDTMDRMVALLSRAHPHIFGKAKERKRILDFMLKMAITFDHVREETESSA